MTLQVLVQLLVAEDSVMSQQLLQLGVCPMFVEVIGRHCSQSPCSLKQKIFGMYLPYFERKALPSDRKQDEGLFSESCYLLRLAVEAAVNLIGPTVIQTVAVCRHHDEPAAVMSSQICMHRRLRFLSDASVIAAA